MKKSASLRSRIAKPKALSEDMQVVPAEFYARETRQVAIDLLGKVLWVRQPRTGTLVGGRIVETEAYAGTDPASHSSRGLTPRCAPMFEEPGHAYVYFTYGMYEMLNFVAEPPGQAGAVLIRGIEPLGGVDVIAKNRVGVPEKNRTNGPGRLCRALGIKMKDNRESLRGPRFLVCEGDRDERVMMSPRVGISKATELEWRFFLDGNPHVSPVRENKVARPLGARKSSPIRVKRGEFVREPVRAARKQGMEPARAEKKP